MRNTRGGLSVCQWASVVERRREEPAEVSRGHSSAQAGARRPELVEGGETAPVSQAASPRGGVGLGRTGAAEKDPAQGELMERILAPENMREAWARVKANGGAAGVDAMSTSDFPAFAREHWAVVREKCNNDEMPPGLLAKIEACFGEDFDGDGAIG